MLEYAWDPGFFQRGIRAGSDEIRYSLYRKQIVGGKIVRHIHGEAKAPSSVCRFWTLCRGFGKTERMLLAHEPGVRDVVLFNLLRGENGRAPEVLQTCFYARPFFCWLWVGSGGGGRLVAAGRIQAFLMNANYRGWLPL